MDVSASTATSFTLAGASALATRREGSSIHWTTSIFSPRSSFTTRRTREPFAPLPELLASPSFGIVPKDTPDTEDFEDNLVTSGPYELEQRTDALIELRKNTTTRPAGQLAGEAFDAWTRREFRFLRSDGSVRAWTAPDVFDPDRSGPNPALTFGFGTHFCIGSHLALAEITTGLSALLDRLPDLRLAGGADPQVEGVILRGPAELPVTFTPSR